MTFEPFRPGAKHMRQHFNSVSVVALCCAAGIGYLGYSAVRMLLAPATSKPQ